MRPLKDSKKKIKFPQNKASMLLALQQLVTKGVIKPLVIVKVTEWRANPQAVLEKITRFFSCPKIIVRSAAALEDSAESSMAGHFKSIANIATSDQHALENAIEQVIESYGENQADQHFFVQEQVLNIKLAGVLFTRELDSLAPYHVINYDLSSDSDGVTSGSKNNLHTYIRAKCSPFEPDSSDLKSLIALSDELENILGSDMLDIEFAIDQADQVYLLQVRPLIGGVSKKVLSISDLERLLNKIARKTEKVSAAHPGLFGERGVYSVMTDWNPAEMIGIRPRRLALSLYKELITDSTWAYQRDNYGYRNLRGYPLLISFLEQPYIDVRVSLNSFIPKGLDDQLTTKLANYYIERLLDSPVDHDKVEFKIVFSCYDLNLADRISLLSNYGFSQLELDRIKFALLNLTNQVISPTAGLYKKDYEKLKKLLPLCEQVLNSHLSTIEKIYWLVQHCKRFGTLPFAGLARAGFIAVQMLNSLVETGILPLADRDRFLGSLATIGKQLAIDTEKLRRQIIGKDEFLEKYGHLRPGTYDILSRTYTEAFDDYFATTTNTVSSSTETHLAEFNLTKDQENAINQLLSANGLKLSSHDLFEFMRLAIEGREYGKFVFTKIVSQILNQVQLLGERHNLSKEEMSWVDIQTLIKLYSCLTSEDVDQALIRDISDNQGFWKISNSIKLPQVISCQKEVFQFFQNTVEPNFITSKRTTRILVTEDKLLATSITDKIVFITQADPGFDWIFTRGIAGLITMYGGANSHMAIRCSELQIPAIIGCGEDNFKRWSRSRVLELDCANKQVRVVE